MWFEQQDLSPIVKEVVCLLETYSFSGLFDGYLSRFLAQPGPNRDWQAQGQVV